MRTLRYLAALAPLFLTSAACTAILGTFEFDTGTSTGSGGKGGTSTGSSTSSGGTSTGGGGTAGGGSDGGHDAATPPEITPSTAKMGILRALQLSASTAVDWTVEETGGGSVDASGRYISPATPGTYHVKATSKADGQTASATIDVGPLGVTILTNYGGMGNIDGPAKRAHFNNPSGTAYFALPNEGLIIADTGNHTIRKYDGLSQKVTTLAGLAGAVGTADGIGSAARLNGPSGVAIHGQVAFISDTGNNCIRTVGILSGQVTTLAGQCGSASVTTDAATGIASRFATPRTLTVNATGSALYVCEQGTVNSSIRRVDISSGATTTVIPNLAFCEVGPVSNELGNPIYYTSGSELSRFKEGAPPNFTPTVEDLSSMPYSYSAGLGTDSGYTTGTPSIYVVLENTAIFQFDINTATFGSGALVGQPHQAGYADGNGTSARFAWIEGMASAGSMHRLYVVDRTLAAIREVDMDTLAVTTKIGAAAIVDRIDGPKDVARLTVPVALAANGSGALCIGSMFADTGYGKAPDSTIRCRDPQTGAISTFAGTPNTNGTLVDGPAGTAKFGLPYDLAYDGEDLYVLDLMGDAIRKVAKDGQVTTIAGELGVPGSDDAHFAFYVPSSNTGGGGIAADHKGNLYVADAGNYSIRKIVLTTGQVTTIAGGTSGSANGNGKNAQFVAPTGLAIAGNTLFIADAGDNTIRAMDLTTLDVSTFVGLSGSTGYTDGDFSIAQFEAPGRLLADGLGNLFVAEAGLVGAHLGTIRRVDIATRTTSTFAGTRGALGLAPGPLSSATLNCPVGMTLLPNGDLAFSDVCDAALAVISPL